MTVSVVVGVGTALAVLGAPEESTCEPTGCGVGKFSFFSLASAAFMYRVKTSAGTSPPCTESLPPVPFSESRSCAFGSSRHIATLVDSCGV